MGTQRVVQHTKLVSDQSLNETKWRVLVLGLPLWAFVHMVKYTLTSSDANHLLPKLLSN